MNPRALNATGEHALHPERGRKDLMDPGRLPRAFASPFFLATFLVGCLLTLYGLLGATICLNPGGCRPDPTWFLFLPGIGLLVVSWVIFRGALRSKSKPG